jgi:hypothetical protein
MLAARAKVLDGHDRVDDRIVSLVNHHRIGKNHDFNVTQQKSRSHQAKVALDGVRQSRNTWVERKLNL